MSLLGKIFAILNILAVVGFVVLGMLDYAKRQTWAHAVFRQDLRINGLPVDETERTADGQLKFQLISEAISEDLFRQGRGPAVTTQEAEVRRYKADTDKYLAEVQGRLQGVPETRQALYSHATLLLPFAQTRTQRELLLADLDFFDSKAHSDALNTAIDQAWRKAQAEQAEFDKWAKDNPNPEKGHERVRPDLRDSFEVLLGVELKEAKLRQTALPLVAGLVAAHKAAQSKPILELFEAGLEAQRKQVVDQLAKLFSDAQAPRQDQGPDDKHRRGIARLLFNLAGPLYVNKDDSKADLTASPVYDRYLTVVGLDAAVPAIHDAADNLAELARQVDGERTQERGLFALEHRKLLNRIIEMAEQVATDRAVLGRKQQQQVTHEEELKKRRREVADYENELKEERRLTAEQMAQLRKMTDELFAERVKLRNATEDNQKLEKQIRALEAAH
jgi:hypothetical protein